MKKYIYFAFIIVAIACQAQNPVLNIGTPNFSVSAPKDAYFKDLNGDLNGYDGTYVYTNGTNTFTMALKKKEMSRGYYYQDLIIGEFQFIKDGIELYNSLNNINVNYTNEELNHLISGNFILTGTEMGCTDCAPTEQRLRLSYIDPRSESIIGLDIRKTTVNGTAAIKVKVFCEDCIHYAKIDDPNPQPELQPRIVPLGEYLMIKQ